jgi:hypothetical protein
MVQREPQHLDKKYVESFERRCWRRMKKTLWFYCVKNEVLRIFREEKNVLPTV